MSLFTLPGDDFLKGTVDIANEANGLGQAVKPSDVGMTHQGIRPRIRQAGARLGLTGLIEGIASHTIDQHVTPFIVNSITEGAQGVAAAIRNPGIIRNTVAQVPQAGFGGAR